MLSRVLGQKTLPSTRRPLSRSGCGPAIRGPGGRKGARKTEPLAWRGKHSEQGGPRQPPRQVGPAAGLTPRTRSETEPTPGWAGARGRLQAICPAKAGSQPVGGSHGPRGHPNPFFHPVRTGRGGHSPPGSGLRPTQEGPSQRWGLTRPPHPPALGPSPSGALSLWPALLSVPCGVDKPGSLCPLPPHTTESRNPTLTPPGLPETEPQTETRNRDLRSGGPARKTGSKPWALLTARETPWLSMPRACGLNKGFPLRQGHVQLCLPDTLPNPTGLTDLHRDTLREFPRGFREAVGPGHLLLGTPGPGL